MSRKGIFKLKVCVGFDTFPFGDEQILFFLLLVLARGEGDGLVPVSIRTLFSLPYGTPATSRVFFLCPSSLLWSIRIPTRPVMPVVRRDDASAVKFYFLPFTPANPFLSRGFVNPFFFFPQGQISG